MRALLYTLFELVFGRRLAQPNSAALARMDAATYAAMVAEAERIASPYRRHLAGQRQPAEAPTEELGGEFPDVEALLERAGILV